MPTISPTAPAAASTGEELGGVAGFATDLIDALGAPGVGVLTFAETVFPPIPSEIILPLAGFVASRGDLDYVQVLVAATLGGYFGAVLLYGLGRLVGERRSIRALSRLPLVDARDFERSAGWLHRHGRSAVFFGRLVPGVRSLISLPAGATRMPFARFSVFTIAGTLIWNAVLVTLGLALGRHYDVVVQYSEVLDVAVYAVLAGVVVWLVVRALRRRGFSARR